MVVLVIYWLGWWAMDVMSLLKYKSPCQINSVANNFHFDTIELTVNLWRHPRRCWIWYNCQATVSNNIHQLITIECDTKKMFFYYYLLQSICEIEKSRGKNSTHFTRIKYRPTCPTENVNCFPLRLTDDEPLFSVCICKCCFSVSFLQPFNISI